jgi:hypothetical protein
LLVMPAHGPGGGVEVLTGVLALVLFVVRFGLFGLVFGLGGFRRVAGVGVMGTVRPPARSGVGGNWPESGQKQRTREGEE